MPLRRHTYGRTAARPACHTRAGGGGDRRRRRRRLVVVVVVVVVVVEYYYFLIYITVGPPRPWTWRFIEVRLQLLSKVNVLPRQNDGGQIDALCCCNSGRRFCVRRPSKIASSALRLMNSFLCITLETSVSLGTSFENGPLAP